MSTFVSRFGAGLSAVILAAGLLLAGGPLAGTAHACSCASLLSLKEEIQSSDAVFSGEVRSVVGGTTPGGATSSVTGTTGTAAGKVSFEVRDSWKGVASETVDVYGQGDGGNCYSAFEEGEAYVVYASRAKGMDAAPAPLQNNECGATKPLADAEEDLRLLGSPAERLPPTGGLPLTFVGALAAASLAGAFLAIRAMRGRR